MNNPTTDIKVEFHHKYSILHPVTDQGDAFLCSVNPRDNAAWIPGSDFVVTNEELDGILFEAMERQKLTVT